MKYSVFAFAILTLSIATNAQGAEKPRFTDDQINQVLVARGLPPLGGSRVLHDDHRPGPSGRTTVIVGTTHIESSSTITSK